MTEQDVREVELVSERQQAEVERLTDRLKQESERAVASMRLLDTVVGTVMGLAKETADVASRAFDLTETVEGLMSRTDRVMHELYYVQTEGSKAEPAAMALLARQLSDIAHHLNIQVQLMQEEDMQVMRDLGEDERQEGIDRREAEHAERAKSMFRDEQG